MQYGAPLLDHDPFTVDLQGSWFTGHLDIVLQLGLCATGPQRKHTSVLKREFNQLAIRVHWQHLHMDERHLTLLLLSFVWFSWHLKRGTEWGKAVLELSWDHSTVYPWAFQTKTNVLLYPFNYPRRCLLLWDEWYMYMYVVTLTGL